MGLVLFLNLLLCSGAFIATFWPIYKHPKASAGQRDILKVLLELFKKFPRIVILGESQKYSLLTFHFFTKEVSRVL